jgi:hypothetical protein
MTIFENRGETLREETSGVKVNRCHDGNEKGKMPRADRLKQREKP